MSRKSSRPLAKLNLPLIVLWLASVVVVVVGYLLVTSSNSSQAALYAEQTADYGKLFAAQSGSTVGGLLIAVGVLGALLALAAQVAAGKRADAPERVLADDAELDNEPIDGEPVDHALPVDAQATDGAAPVDDDTNVEEPVRIR